MISHFKRFDGHSNLKIKETFRVTLSPRRYFALNDYAYRMTGSPDAVELYFDDHERKVGIMRCDPLKKNAFLMRKEKGKSYHLIYAGAFLTHFAISTKRTVLFLEPSVTQEGMLILDMTKTINVGRGSRRKLDAHRISSDRAYDKRES